MVNAFPYLKRVTATPAVYPRFIKFAAGCPRKVLQTPGPPARSLPLPRDLAPRPAEPNSLGNIFRLFKKWLMSSAAGENSLPAARGRCCRHRTTSHELALTPAPCTPAGGTAIRCRLPAKIFDFLKRCRHRTTTQKLALTPARCTPAGGTEFPAGKFSTF